MRSILDRGATCSHPWGILAKGSNPELPPGPSLGILGGAPSLPLYIVGMGKWQGGHGGEDEKGVCVVRTHKGTVLTPLREGLKLECPPDQGRLASEPRHCPVHSPALGVQAALAMPSFPMSTVGAASPKGPWAFLFLPFLFLGKGFLCPG